MAMMFITMGDLATCFIRPINSCDTLASELTHERTVDVRLELRRFRGKQKFDVRAAREYTLQIDPLALDIEPDVEDGVYGIELLVPRGRLLFEDLVVWRRFHGGHHLDALAHLTFQPGDHGAAIPC